MKQLIDFFKVTLIGGALVVLPVWLAMLLLFKALLQVEGVVKPLSAELPASVAHPQVIAAIFLIGLCFLVGLTIQTVAGSQAKRIVEKNVLNHIPGYMVLHHVAQQMVDVENNRGFKPALVDINDALALAFIVEELGDGKCTVFLPSAPTPLTGSILIIAKTRVHPVDVSIPQIFSITSKWGNGAGELLTNLHDHSTGHANPSKDH